jgi:hypothetical protein
MISSVQNELVFDANELPTGFGRYQKAPFGFGNEPDRADMQEARRARKGSGNLDGAAKDVF